MESEKVKEIKESLEHNAYFAIEYFPKAGRPKVFKLDDILTLINELESENERLILQYERVKADSEMNCLELKDRIAELKKEIEENAFYSKGYAQGIKNTYEVVIPDKLKQFAERLKEISCEMYLKKQLHRCIDETLKEFIKG